MNSMQEWFARAKSVRIESEIARRSIKLAGQNERIGPCPVCGGVDRFSINLRKQFWNCRQCKAGGDVIDLVRHIDKCSTVEAGTTLVGPPPINGAGGNPWIPEGEWIYLEAGGKPYLKVRRFRLPDGKKSYPQSHLNGAGWKNGAPAGPKIPYRLPDLLKADPNEPVWITEGEKCADEVRGLGLVATSASGGAGKWTADLNEYFRDRIVYVLPDNDPPGTKHAHDVARNLKGIAKAVCIVQLPDLADKEDVYDWIKQGGTRADLEQIAWAAPEWCESGIGQNQDGTLGEKPQADEPKADQVKPFAVVKAPDMEGVKLPSRRWIFDNLLPAGEFCLFNGMGGASKTQSALQKAVAIALAADFIGMLSNSQHCGPALFISMEETNEEIARRIENILRHLHKSFKDVPNLHWQSFVNEPKYIAVVNPRTGMVERTRFYDELELTIADGKYAYVGIENTAQVFCGSEIDRTTVQAFGSVGTRLAHNTGAAIEMLQHVSLSGQSTGRLSSGSTQWENSCRFRSSIAKPTSDDGKTEIKDRRIFRFHKTNYSKENEGIKLKVDDTGYLLLDMGPGGIEQMISDTEAMNAFLSCLDEFARQGRYMSPNRGQTYAPTEFAKSSIGISIGKVRLERAMQILFEEHKITTGHNPTKPPSHAGTAILRV
jgi:RecA-family ATPase